MEEELGIFGPVNLGLEPFNIVKTPPTPAYQDADKGSAVDRFYSMMNKGIPQEGQTFTYVPTKDLDLSGRYPKLYPTLDNESLYAQGQGTFEKLGNGLVKMGGIGSATFINTTAGFLYGATQWARTGEFNSMYDNPLTRELNEFNNEYLESTFANYKTQREREGEWWEPENLFTANFLADNIIKNLGFAAGAFAGGFAWTGALRALGLSSRLIAQGKNMAAATDAAISSATALPQAQRLSAINTALNQLSSTAKVATGRAFMGAERGIVSTIAAAGEAGIEALSASQEFRQSMIDKYIADNGFNPTGADLQEINDTATRAGNTVYGLNFGLLSLSNFVQLPKIFSSTFKGEKNLVNDVIFKGGKWTSKLPESTLGKSLYKARGFGKLLFNIDEALEEAAQYAVQVGTENYFSKLRETGDANVLDDLFFNGAKEALTSSEGLLNFTIGGVSGAIMGARGRIIDKGFTGYGGKEGKVRKEFIDAWNNTLVKNRLKDRAQTISANQKIQEERAQKIVDGDISGAKDLEFDYLFGDMYNRVKYSSLENVKQETSELRQFASTEEGFLQLQQQEIAHATDTRQSFLNRLDTIERQAKQIDQIYNDTNLKFKGVLGEDKKPLYNDDVIKKLTYAASKIYDYDSRIPSLNGKLINGGVNTTEVFNDVITNGNTPKETVEKALSTIKDPVNSDELTQDLFELIEMGMKRKKFIDEYNEIKTNPKKYTPAPETKPTVIPEEKVGEKVKIKTKAGEKEVSVGEEYSLGAPVDFQKDGLDLEVKTYNITVLGENEDGTIKIITSSGKERDVSKEEFAKYNLIPLSEIQSNKTAKYYDAHKNEIFEYNFGKDFGGKKQGRIEYRNGNLYFKYKDSKGKVQEKKLNRSHFVAQEGFDTARITITGKVPTAAQKKAEAEYLEQQQLEIDVNNAQENRAKRIEILSNLIEETKQEQKDLDSLIAKKKAELQTISNELSELEDKILSTTGDRDLRYKKGIRFKSSTRKALAAANRLSKMKDDLQNEISRLEARREDIEIDFSYLSDMAQNIEELPGASNEFLKELREHVSFIKDLVEEKENQISEIKGILPKVQEAIDSAIDFLSNLVSEFQKKFPKVPLSIGQEWIDFLKANPNFLKRKPTYTQELKQLEDMVAQVEDLDIEPGERTIQELNASLKDLESDLSDLRNQLKSTEFVLSKFENIARLYLEQKAQEEQMLANEELKKQILGTADNENPVAIIHDKEYEPNFKKPKEIIPRATLGIDRGKSHQKRAQKFGVNFRKLPQGTKSNIRGIYITHKNQDQLIPGLMDHLRTDENGVNDTVDPNTTIAMVMVDVSQGTPVLVNLDGEPLTEEQLQDPLNNAIYQVFPLEELKWSGEYGDESMFAKDVPENQRSAIRAQYTKWRSKVLAVEDLSEIHTIEASFGIPQVETDSEGKKLYDTTTSVEDAGLVSDWELDNEPMITVVVNDDDLVRGISKVKAVPGRVFLEMGTGLVPLNNRQHTKKEAEAIFSAILQLSKNTFDKTKGIDSEQSETLLTFLRSVVYWGIPKNDAGYNSVFFKNGKLFMSGKNQSFPFTPSGLLNNKEVIVEVLTGMYHNVNATMVRNPNENYYQFVGVSDSGEIQTVTWPNYQSYLLSSVTPDGKSRSGAELPLSTNVRPLENADDTNITGIYFYTTDTGDYFSIPEEEKLSKIKPVAPKKETAETSQKFVLDGKTENNLKLPNGTIVFMAPKVIKSINDITIVPNDYVKNLVKEYEAKNPGKNGKIIIKEKVYLELKKYLEKEGPVQPKVKITVDKSGDEVYSFDEDEEETYEAPTAPKPKAPQAPVSDINSLIDKRIVEKKLTNGRYSFFPNEEAVEKNQSILITEKNVDQALKAGRSWGEFIIDAKTKNITGLPEPYIYVEISKGSSIEFINAKDLENFINDPSENIKDREIARKKYNELAALEGTKPAESKKVAETKKKEEEEDEDEEYRFDEDEETDEDEEEYTFDDDADNAFNNPDKIEGYEELREVVLNEAKGVQVENWNEIEAAWKQMLPGVPLYRLKNIIEATNGRQAWGMLKNGAIYVYENAEVGTFYHEVFEAIWKMFTNPTEQQAILNEFKSRKGSFVDRPTGKSVKYSEATPQQIKEQLAEEFRDYKLYKKLPPKPERGGSWISKLFADIVAFVKKFFTGSDAQSNTEKLFSKIGNGYYSRYTPEMGVLENVQRNIIDLDSAVANEEDELRITIPYKEQNDIIQHMTYVTLSKLTKTNQSLFRIMDLNKKNLYEELRLVISSRLGMKNQANEQNYKEGKLSKKEYENEKALIEKTFKQTKKEWNEIVERHIEYLKGYQIEFDENDMAQMNDENKIKDSDYVDATKVDSLRKSNVAIKLLLATLPKAKRVEGETKPIPTMSSIGGVELLPMSQAFITVMNEVHTSRDISEMMNRVRDLASRDANYFILYNRLSNDQPVNQAFDFGKIVESHQLQLISSFWSVFKKQNPSVKNVFILEGGEVVIGDANLSTASAQIAKDFENSMLLSAKKGDGYFERDEKLKAFVVKDKIDKVGFTESSTGEKANQMLNFLNSIGIQFSKQEYEKLSNEDKIKFGDAVSGIRDSLKATRVLMTFSDKKMDVRGRLLTLGLMKYKSSHPEIESTYFNVSNERTQTYIGSNPISDLHDFLSSVTDLNSAQVSQSQYKYLVNDPFSKGSLILRRMFPVSRTTTKRVKVSEKNSNHKLLTVGYAGGTINNDNGKQKPSDQLTYVERLIQEINLNLEGWYLNLVPGDASIEWMVKMGNHVSVSDIISKSSVVQDIFKDYFIDEFNLAKSPDRFVDASREKEKNNLRFFFDILGKELNNEIVNSKYETGEEAYKAFKTQINSAVDSYINAEADSLQALLNKYGVIESTETGYKFNKVTSSDSTFRITDNMSKDLMMSNLKALSVNYMIANIELHKILYSDPYQYKDELKRIKSFSSPRQAILAESSDTSNGKGINSALNNVWNVGFNKTDIGYTNFNRNFFRTATHTDVMAVVDIPGKDYGLYTETDGSGIITLKAHRNLKIRAGQWTDGNELQYRHDVAYEKLSRSGATQEQLDEFDSENNPEVRDTYTPVKPIVAGNAADRQDYNSVVLDKFALYPLSYRILHKINSTSNAMKLYDKMQKEDIDYVVFESGRKVGSKNPHTTYNEDGSFNDSLYVSAGPNRNVVNVPFQIISIQTEVPSKEKALITRGSQVTKLLTMDFMDAGIPVDFEKDLSFPERYKKWNKLADEDAREKNSKVYKEIKRNQTLLQEMTKFGYELLLKDLGISEVDGGYKITDFSAAAETLRDEILKREVNENIIDSLKSFLDGKTILEATPAYQQIRNIIYSIVDKEISGQKISGGMKVQIPSTFLLDSNNIKTQTINEKTGFVSESLKFYETGGERVAEVMIGRWFDSPLSDEELLKYLNTTEEGQKILKGLAYRIPTQNHNSMDVIKIAKFLPKEFGDSVVIPSAMVAKVGSDFDIDKLSIYLKNVFKDIDGKIKVVPFYGYGEQAINKFKELVEKIAEIKVEKLNKKLLKEEGLRQMFVDIATGNTSSGFAQIWIPKFKEWFANEVVDGKLSVELVGGVFAKRFEKLNKKLENLTVQDLHDAFVEEYADRLYKQSLQNEYMDSSEKIIQSDFIYNKLMTPNSAQQLKDLATVITRETSGVNYDYKNVGNMLSREYMSSLRHAFVRGKYAIGIAAVNQTNHSLMQRFASVIDPERLDRVADEDLIWLGDGKVKFEKFNKIDGKATLSMTKNAERSEKYPDGQFISDIIGQFIDGYVDISKGPWIMQLGATPNVASTWLFLAKIGVPIEDIAYFMNQPIIRDYLRKIEVAGYSWLFIDKYVESMMEIYDPGVKNIAQRNTIPSRKTLENNLSKSVDKMTPDEKADQQFILNEFLKYAKMGSHLFEVTQATNYDTAMLNDPFLLYKKAEQFKKAQKTLISSVEDIMENSFIGVLYTTLNDARNAMAEILTSDKRSVRNVIQKVLKPYVSMNDRDFVKVARRVVSDLFDYAVQTDDNFKNSVYDVMVKDGGYAYEISRMVESIKNDRKHPLHNNHVINIITPELSKDLNDSANNIIVKGATNKIYDQNNIINGFREIREHFNSIGKPEMYSKFEQLAFFQSGLSVNRFSFTSLLPYEDFEKIYSATIQKLESINLNAFADLHVFERNNWGNYDIVPQMKAPLILRPGKDPLYNPGMKFYGNKNVIKAINEKKVQQLVSIRANSMEGNHDIITYTWEDESINYTKRKEMKKIGDYSYINRGLFKKVKDPKTGEPLKTYDQKGTEYHVYSAINAWGARERAQEFYDVEKPSEIDNGFIKVLNPKADEVIIGLFTGKSIPATQTQPVKQGTILGNIKLNIIEDWVQKGQATTTVRNTEYHSQFFKGDGLYKTDAGNVVEIKYRGPVKVQGDNVVGNGFSYTKDEFAAAEGFGNWKNFTEKAQYAGKNLIVGSSVHLYAIKPVQTKTQAPKEGTTKSNTPKIDNNKRINIYAGTGENAELSNFAKRPYTDPLGVTYATVEGAFQAAKLNYATGNNEGIDMKLQTASGAEAKSLGSQIKGLNIQAWDQNSSQIMKSIIKESFIENPNALRKLMSTGNALLTHTQDKGKWGKEFPRILMEIRFELADAKLLESLRFNSDEIGKILKSICNGNVS